MLLSPATPDSAGASCTGARTRTARWRWSSSTSRRRRARRRSSRCCWRATRRRRSSAAWTSSPPPWACSASAGSSRKPPRSARAADVAGGSGGGDTPRLVMLLLLTAAAAAAAAARRCSAPAGAGVLSGEGHHGDDGGVPRDAAAAAARGGRRPLRERGGVHRRGGGRRGGRHRDPVRGLPVLQAVRAGACATPLVVAASACSAPRGAARRGAWRGAIGLRLRYVLAGRVVARLQLWEAGVFDEEAKDATVSHTTKPIVVAGARAARPRPAPPRPLLLLLLLLLPLSGGGRAGKDVTEVDNDFFLVPVSILNHNSDRLKCSFPVENRIIPQGVAELRVRADAERWRRLPRG
eukprot:scaffold4263_cov260-Prasinococcus_capsulatus_cf.AAC.1